MADIESIQRELERLRSENELLRCQLHLQSGTQARGVSRHRSISASKLVESSVSLDTAQLERYARQISLKSFGPKAQEVLCASSALIVGAGGLGCPCALYLAAAGIGRLGIADNDTVSLGNLHRQVAHTERGLGQHKADSAAAACVAIDAGLAVELHRGGLRPDNAQAVCAAYDVVLDCSDNAPTRYLVNDACVMAGKPLVSGAAVGTDGQLTVYNHDGGPCYRCALPRVRLLLCRCLYPDCPAAVNCSRCEDAGVLGPVPGVIGTLQAIEAIKVLTGVGKPLSQRLLIYDALATRFSTVKLRSRRPDCGACGTASHLAACGGPAGYDYAAFTGGQPMAEAAAPVTLVDGARRATAEQLRQHLEDGAGEGCVVLDVRPEGQFSAARIAGSVNIPIEQVDRRWEEVKETICKGSEHGKTAFVVCRRGNDSQIVLQRLLDEGVEHVWDVVGGLDEWSRAVDAAMPLL